MGHVPILPAPIQMPRNQPFTTYLRPPEPNPAIQSNFWRVVSFCLLIYGAPQFLIPSSTFFSVPMLSASSAPPTFAQPNVVANPPSDVTKQATYASQLPRVVQEIIKYVS